MSEIEGPSQPDQGGLLPGEALREIVPAPIEQPVEHPILTEPFFHVAGFRRQADKHSSLAGKLEKKATGKIREALAAAQSSTAEIAAVAAGPILAPLANADRLIGEMHTDVQTSIAARLAPSVVVADQYESPQVVITPPEESTPPPLVPPTNGITPPPPPPVIRPAGAIITSEPESPPTCPSDEHWHLGSWIQPLSVCPDRSAQCIRDNIISTFADGTVVARVQPDTEPHEHCEYPPGLSISQGDRLLHRDYIISATIEHKTKAELLDDPLWLIQPVAAIYERYYSDVPVPPECQPPPPPPPPECDHWELWRHRYKPGECKIICVPRDTIDCPELWEHLEDCATEDECKKKRDCDPRCQCQPDTKVWICNPSGGVQECPPPQTQDLCGVGIIHKYMYDDCSQTYRDDFETYLGDAADSILTDDDLNTQTDTWMSLIPDLSTEPDPLIDEECIQSGCADG